MTDPMELPHHADRPPSAPFSANEKSPVKVWSWLSRYQAKMPPSTAVVHVPLTVLHDPEPPSPGSKTTEPSTMSAPVTSVAPLTAPRACVNWPEADAESMPPGVGGHR